MFENCAPRKSSCKKWVIKIFEAHSTTKCRMHKSIKLNYFEHSNTFESCKQAGVDNTSGHFVLEMVCNTRVEPRCVMAHVYLAFGWSGQGLLFAMLQLCQNNLKPLYPGSTTKQRRIQPSLHSCPCALRTTKNSTKAGRI